MAVEQHNEVFDLALQLVNYTDKHVFLTGKAGTGKTTFLKYIREHTHKNTAVVAPTGVAAINAGGTTLHSLLQLPFGAFVPDGHRPMHIETREEIHDRQSLVRRLRFSGNKRKVIEALELLIIDEISMVRADLLDMVDTVLRFVRKRPQMPFGGVQVLYIGDMFQLPPVQKDTDREILKDYYKSQFFFDARVIQQAPPLYVELTHVYRQSDETFIEVLNQVRNNELTDDGLALLKQRYHPGFKPPPDESYITLATHNYMADQINAAELEALPGCIFEFDAKVEDDFPEHAYPVEKKLRLKLGAQVMFLKNDLDTPRRFFNGKIGIVTNLDKDKIEVQCKEDDTTISVPLETWKNIRYTYEAQTRSVKEDELGKFSQYPLRLAWAITIHKSQGLTFEKAIIDAGKAFEAGQVYVALSRCTSLEGMVLLSPLHRGLVMTHERIALFGRKERLLHDLHVTAAAAKRKYLHGQLMDVLNFTEARMKLIQLQQLFRDFHDMFNSTAGDWLNTLQQQVEQLHASTHSLLPDLHQLLDAAADFEKDDSLQRFLKTHAPTALATIQEKIWLHWRRMPGMQPGHSRRSAEGFFNLVEELNEWLKERILRLNRLKDGFSVDCFFATRSSAGDGKPEVKSVAVTPGPSEFRSYAEAQAQAGDAGIEHIQLYRRLRKLTDAIVVRESIPSYIVATAAMLREMCQWLPQTTDELLHIKGFGKKKIEWYGDEFVEEIVAYCEENGLQPERIGRPLPEKRVRREQKAGVEKKPKVTMASTVEATLDVWRQGKTVTEIAEARNLSAGTIENHFATAIEQGNIQVDQVLDKAKIFRIKALLPVETLGVSLTPIKEQLGDNITYGEIRMVLAQKRYDEATMKPGEPVFER